MPEDEISKCQVQKEELFVLLSMFPDLILSVAGFKDRELSVSSLHSLTDAIHPLKLKVIFRPHIDGPVKKKQSKERFVILSIECDVDYPSTSPVIKVDQSKRIRPHVLDEFLVHLRQLLTIMKGQVCLKELIEGGVDFFALDEIPVDGDKEHQNLLSPNIDRPGLEHRTVKELKLLERAVEWRAVEAQLEDERRRLEKQKLANLFTSNGEHSEVADAPTASLSDGCSVAQHRSTCSLHVPVISYPKSTPNRRSKSPAATIEVQRGCCIDGPHTEMTSFGSGYPKASRARFSGLLSSTGRLVRVDEWLFHCPDGAQKSTGQKTSALCMDVLNSIASHLPRWARIASHSTHLCQSIAFHHARNESLSGVPIAGDWKRCSVVRLISDCPPGVSVSSLNLPVSHSDEPASLTSQKQQRLRLPIRQSNLEWVRHITSQVVTTLAFLHANSMAHRNLQPETVFIDQDGQVFLSDYGYIARLNQLVDDIASSEGKSPVTLERFRTGRRYYKQLQRKDIRQLGLFLLYLVTGRSISDSIATCSPIINQLIRDLRTVCSTLADLMRSCFEDRIDVTSKRLCSHPFLRDPVPSAPALINPTPFESQNSRPSPTSPAAQSTKKPRLLEDFDGFSVIGKGGFGCVLKARNIMEDREYAIKCIKIDDSQVEMLFREIRTLSALQHDNIVRYFTSWQDIFPQPLPLPTMPWTDSALDNGAVSSTSSSEDSAEVNPSLDISLIQTVPDMSTLSSQATEIGNDDSNVDSWCPTKETSALLAHSGLFRKPTESSDSDSDPADQSLIFNHRSFGSRTNDVFNSNTLVFGSDGGSTASFSSVSSSEDELKTTKSNGSLRYIIIQMELCALKTLRHVIDFEGLSSTPDRAWSFFRELADGLAYIHSKSVIHRDLKPANIMLDANDHVKIVDFGLATKTVQEQVVSARNEAEAVERHTADLEHTFGFVPDCSELSQQTVSSHAQHQSSTIKGSTIAQGDCSMTRCVGTYLYMSPEVLTSRRKHLRYDERVDIYSLGIILFEMFYRAMPVVMERVAILTELRKEHILFPSDWNAKKLSNQTRLIRMMLQHDPDRRISASDLLASPYVPPLKSTEAAFRKQLVEICKDTESAMYRFVANTLFSQSCSRPSDLLYDHSVIPRLITVTDCRTDQLGQLDGKEVAKLGLTVKEFCAYQRIHRDIVRSMESTFLVHNGCFVQPPALLPVVNRLPQSAKNIRSNKQPSQYLDGAFARARATHSGTCPIFLNAQGTTVSLPESLHISFARFLARSGSALITGREDSWLKCYQFGRGFSTLGHVSGADYPPRSLDHPVEQSQAAFDIVSREFNPMATIELFEIWRELITTQFNSKNVRFLLYLNHTSLTEIIFTQADIPPDSVPSLWHHLAEANRSPTIPPDHKQHGPVRTRRLTFLPFISADASRRHSQRQFLRMLHFESSVPADLRGAIFEHSRHLKPSLRRRVDEAINRLDEITQLVEKLGAKDTFELRCTPGLVLPCHFYAGLVFQLVAEFQPNPTSCLTKGVPPSELRNALMVVAQGGEYAHLIAGNCLPKDYNKLNLKDKGDKGRNSTASSLRLPPLQVLNIKDCPYVVGFGILTEALVRLHLLLSPSIEDAIRNVGRTLEPYPCRVLLSWTTRESNNPQEFYSTPFKHLPSVSARRGGATANPKGTVDSVSVPQSSLNVTGEPSGLMVTTMTITSPTTALESYLTSGDAVQLALALAKKLWCAGLSCELSTSTDMDVIRDAESRVVDFAIRVNVLTLSANLVSANPHSTAPYSSAVTYQLWTRHGGLLNAGQCVMVAEMRRPDPDSVVSFIRSRLAVGRQNSTSSDSGLPLDLRSSTGLTHHSRSEFLNASSESFGDVKDESSPFIGRRSTSRPSSTKRRPKRGK